MSEGTEIFQVTVSSPVAQATLALTFSGPHSTKTRGEKTSQVICNVHSSSRQKLFTALNLLPESMLIGVELDVKIPLS